MEEVSREVETWFPEDSDSCDFVLATSTAASSVLASRACGTASSPPCAALKGAYLVSYNSGERGGLHCNREQLVASQYPPNAQPMPRSISRCCG